MEQINDQALLQSLLEMKPSDFKTFVPLPEGTYIAEIISYAAIESPAKKTPGIQFTLSSFAPLDIDEHRLKEYGDGSVEAATAKMKNTKMGNMGTTFWTTEDDRGRPVMTSMFTEFFNKAIAAPDKQVDKTTNVDLKTMLGACVGREILVNIFHSQLKDGRMVPDTNTNNWTRKS